MAYCSNCGAQIREGARFCDSCGNPVAQATPGATQPPPMPPPAVTAADTGLAKTLLLVGLGLYAVAALFTLMAGNILGFATSLMVVGAIFALAYIPLTKSQNQAAKNGAAIAGIVSLVFALINLFMGDFGAVVFNAIASAAIWFAWNQIK